MKRKILINKFSLPANAGWSATQNKTARSSTTTTTPLFRKVILCTLLPLLLLGAVKTAAQDYSMALVNVDNVSDDRSLELDGAFSVTTAVVADMTYLFVAGINDNGVSVFRVDDGGLLASVHNVTDVGSLELNAAISVTTAVVADTTYLFVAGSSDNGVSVFRVGDTGALANVHNVPDDDDLKLGNAQSVTTAVVDGTTWLFVAGFTDSGVSVFRVGDTGALANVTNVTDDAMLKLNGAVSVTTAVVADTTYLFVAGLTDSGVSVFRVGDTGALANVHNVTNGGSLKLNGAISVTTAVVADTTYLFVAGRNDHGVSVFRVGDTGVLANVTNVTDGGNLELSSAFSVTTAVVDGTTYLFVAGRSDDGVSVFRVGDTGALANVTNVTDNDDRQLDGATSVTTAVVDGTTYLFVAGQSDDGVSVFRLEDAAAPTFGSQTASNQTFAISCEAVSRQLPEATSGNGALTYTLTPAIPGLTFNPVTRMISGTPTTPAAAVMLTYTVTDEDDNSMGADSPSLTFMVTVTADDITEPVPDVASLSALTGECMVMPAAPTAMDNCAGSITGTTTTIFPVTSTSTITWTYEDSEGNMTTQTQEVILMDVTAPVPVEASLAALTGECMVMPAAPTATDNCDAGIITGTTRTIFPVTADATITWTFTDETGNGTTQDQQVTITGDMTGPDPDMTSLLALTGECMVNMPTRAPTATDNCDTGTITGTTDAFPVTSTSTITWTFTDAAMNVTTQTQMVTISDETGPDPDMPSLSALTGECMVETPAAPIATDNCDAGTITGTTDAIFPITTNAIITWTFTDETNNTTTQDQQVTITGDMTAPDSDMTSLPVLTGECSVMPAAPTAMDNCDTGRITGITTTGFPVTETSVITWTFTDMAGNETIQTQDVVIDDVTIPVPEVDPLPALTGQCRVEMATAPIATDNCDGSITGTTDAFPVTSNSTITWTFTDMAGNMATQTQEVVVDVIVPAPEIGRLPALTGQCGRVEMPVAPTATDNCTPRIMGITDAVFPITTNSIIIWTFTDASGNEVRQTQQITIMDVTRPAVDVNPLPVLTGECMVEMPGAPTATDNCDGRIPGITTATFPVTTTSGIIWTFTNMAGNETRQTQQVTITDATGPVPDETSLSALTGECRVNMPAAPIATDICAGSITGITTAIFPVTRDATITWTFTDAAMNETTQDQQVTITGDMTGPDPDMPSLPALTGECSVMPAAPTAMDNCDTGSITGTTTATFPVTATSMIIWTFTDRANNTTTQDQQVTITGDITAPVPDETSLSALTGECSVMPAAPTATDNCDAGSITGTTDAIFPITADATIIWTFTDVAGNTATQTQEVTCMPLGVEEEPGISMYPNPSEGSLAFSTGNYVSLSIKIYRIDGALVFAGIARDNTPINIETLAAGSYVVQAASNGTTVFTSRLLKRDQGLLRG